MAKYVLPLPEAFANIPVTGQSLAVILIGFVMNRVDGPVTILAYLLLGVFGLEIFADNTSGLDVLLGPSGGFLYGFLFSVILSNAVFGKGVDFLNILKYMTFCKVCILIFGGGHLLFFLSWNEMLQQGIEPFLPGAMIKIMTATCIVYGLKNYVLISPDHADQ